MKFHPYIYRPELSIEVLNMTEKYFNQNSDKKQLVESLGWIYTAVGGIIPQTTENFWSGHFFPFIDSWEELQISFNLVCFGFYKQAFASLRSGLELGLLSVYYNINDDGHIAVQNWLRSRDSTDSNTPPSKAIWKILLSNKNIQRFNDKHNLVKMHQDLGYLHNYVHSKGAKYSNRYGKMKSNFQTFEPSMIEKWLESYRDVIKLVTTLHLLKYPLAIIRFDYSAKFGIDIPSFGGLEEHNIKKISELLPVEFIADIEIIAKDDLQTQEVLKEITDLPDMTEEEVEEQIIDMEKIFIESIGFEKWLVQQNELRKMLKQRVFSKKMKKRIETLRTWSSENNYLLHGKNLIR